MRASPVSARSATIPGLESSAATFIDGVYRNRAGVALTELGPIEQVEMLRGPQGTLFGRNASAGLLNITTARPDTQKLGGLAGRQLRQLRLLPLRRRRHRPDRRQRPLLPIGRCLQSPRGLPEGHHLGPPLNNRDRYLVRGKLLYQPSDDLSVLLIADYSHQNEQCCAATYLPANAIRVSGRSRAWPAASSAAR